MASKTAPPVVYIVIDAGGLPTHVDTIPADAEDARGNDERIARYKFEAFVSIEFEPIVKIVR